MYKSSRTTNGHTDMMAKLKNINSCDGGAAKEINLAHLLLPGIVSAVVAIIRSYYCYFDGWNV